MTNREAGDMTQLWKQIWNSNWWPKVIHFIWMVAKGWILTWDQLQKKGTQGPPRCPLCKQDQETQEHLLNTCTEAKKKWEKVRWLFGKSHRDQQSIKNTIITWVRGQFKSPVVRRASSLTAGLNIWMIWKERNRRISQDREMTQDQLWEKKHRAYQRNHTRRYMEGRGLGGRTGRRTVP